MICPYCNNDRGIREIVYGLPVQQLDENKYAIGQTQMYRALGFESAIGLIFDLRKSRHSSLSNTLKSLERDQRTKFVLFS